MRQAHRPAGWRRPAVALPAMLVTIVRRAPPAAGGTWVGHGPDGGTFDTQRRLRLLRFRT